jgi:hypothetical protein
MSNFFEKFINSLFKPKITRSLTKKEIEKEKEKLKILSEDKYEKYSIENENEKQEDETSILIEDNNKNKLNNHINYLNKRKIISKSLIQNKYLPIFYFIFSIFKIILCFISDFFLRIKENSLKIKINSINYSEKFNFFKLYEKNPLIFHIFNFTNGIIGLFIIYFVLNTLQIKFLKNSKLNKNSQFIQIYLASFFGLISHILHIISGMIFLFNNFHEKNKLIKDILKISIIQLLFFIEIIFTSIYGIFICCLITKVNNYNNYELINEDKEKDDFIFIESFNYNYINENKKMNTIKPQKINNIKDNISSKWLNYKIVCLIYLIFFSFSYIFILFNKNEKANKYNINTNNNINSIKDTNVKVEDDFFKINHNYLLMFLPYLIFVLNTIFYSALFGILKFSSTCHIEFTSQNIYDKSHKNML